jgi:hypothetical protein
MKFTGDSVSLGSASGDCDRRLTTLRSVNTPSADETYFRFADRRRARFWRREQSSLCSLIPDGAVTEAPSDPEVLQRSTRTLTPYSIGWREQKSEVDESLLDTRGVFDFIQIELFRPRNRIDWLRDRDRRLPRFGGHQRRRLFIGCRRNGKQLNIVRLLDYRRSRGG